MLTLLPFLVLAAGLFVGVPVAKWRAARRDALGLWTPHATASEQVGDGYRGAPVTRMVADGPPRVVQVTAVLSWVLGTMFVPGLLGGLVGLIAMGFGLLSVPGLVLAWRNFKLGEPLMRGDFEAIDRARGNAGFTVALNAVVLTMSAIGTAIYGAKLAHGDRYDAPGWLALWIFTALYALVSLGHASLLERSAKAIEAEQVRRGHVDDDDAAIEALRAEARQNLSAGAAPVTGVRVALDDEAARESEALEAVEAARHDDALRRAR